MLKYFLYIKYELEMDSNIGTSTMQIFQSINEYMTKGGTYALIIANLIVIGTFNVFLYTPFKPIYFIVKLICSINIFNVLYEIIRAKYNIHTVYIALECCKSLGAKNTDEIRCVEYISPIIEGIISIFIMRVMYFIIYIH